MFRKDNAKIEFNARTKVEDKFPTFLLIGTIVLLIAASFIPYKDGAAEGQFYKPDITNGLICIGFFIIGIIREVFFNKNWLKKSTQRLFVDQINSAFSTLLKCSTDDFHAIEKYFKNNDYTEWTLDDCDAPQCCDVYREIADKFDLEFQDVKYAKPGKVINTRKIEKLR